MRWVLTMLGFAGGMAVSHACSLPTDQKTGCASSVDCVEGRGCIEGNCTDESCELVCSRICALSDACGTSNGCSGPACRSPVTLASLEGYTPRDCADQWDLLAVEDCASAECFEGCRTLCTKAADCLLIQDPVACTLGCQLQSDPCPLAATDPTCADIPTLDVLCYEHGLPAPC